MDYPDFDPETFLDRDMMNDPPGHGWYRLGANGEPVRCRTMREAMPFTEAEDEERRRLKIVRQEYVGKLWVSTVFLLIDHSWMGQGPPVLWETMIFPSGDDMGELACDRCSGSREQAEAMHVRMTEVAWRLEDARINPDPARDMFRSVLKTIGLEIERILTRVHS